jgi:sterol desaturase/sphingolipid hydroxylase (fatty acid hydroxylase superfamily)
LDQCFIQDQQFDRFNQAARAACFTGPAVDLETGAAAPPSMRLAPPSLQANFVDLWRAAAQRHCREPLTALVPLSDRRDSPKIARVGVTHTQQATNPGVSVESWAGPPVCFDDPYAGRPLEAAMRNVLKIETTGGVRLFDNVLLERLSRIHPMTVLMFWAPALLGCLIVGCAAQAVSPTEFIAMFVGAVLVWTLFEYCAHRFLFHLGDRFAWAGRMSFILHGGHHADPTDVTRHVMPLVATIPILSILLAILAQVMPLPHALVLFSFVGFCYLNYDLTHYACHSLPMDNRLGRLLKQNHLRHHFRDSRRDFSVTCLLWDRVFGTRGLRQSRPSPVRIAE